MNKPDEHDLYLDLTELVNYSKDSKIENAATFDIKKEDHTLGNLIRMQLLEDKEVLFAGYRVPHPLKHAIEVKIQTTTNSNPNRAISMALNDLISEFSTLEQRFKEEYDRKKTGADIDTYLKK